MSIIPGAADSIVTSTLYLSFFLSFTIIITMSRRSYFFFSSRRRHTTCLSDWSSDVCSSDLILLRELVPADSVQDELYWLAQAREAGCLWCDLEIETLRKLPTKSIRKYSLPRRILLSVHDFYGMPPLNASLNARRSLADADAIKVAGAARTLSDSVRLLRHAAKLPNCVAVSMGEVGLPARLLALREGSALAYTPVAASTSRGHGSLQ